MMSRRKICLAEVTREYIERPYALGHTAGPGLDCFSLIYDYMGRIGAELPTQWRGLTMQSYACLFERDPAYAKQLMVEFIEEHADEIPPARAFAGDILLLHLCGQPESLPFLAIHGGQTVALAASREFGVRPWDLRHYTIRRAWRCRRQSR